MALIPSLGRAASDFDDLATRLQTAGYQSVAIDPRGLDGTGLDQPVTLHDLADDVAAAIESVGAGPAHIVGHALGNRIARCLAADRPDLVRSLVLLAAGGLVEPAADVRVALLGCFNIDADPDEHLRCVASAFFANPDDAAIWRGGWYPAVAAMQGGAGIATDRSDWWSAAAPGVLVIQGLQDRVAVPENGRRYVAELGERATLVEIDGAGHALLPERPDEVAAAILPFLASMS